MLGRPILDGDSGGTVGCETSTCGGSVFTIHDNVHATVGGVTIQHTVSGGINNVNGATLTVSGSAFYSNFNANGGAIDNGGDRNYLAGGTLTVADSTFTGNTASTHGGTIDNSDNFGSGTVSVTADIFNGGRDQAGGSREDAGYNVGSDASCENGGTSDSAALTPAELGPLASNGGPTQTVRPLEGNPALGIVPPATSVSLGGSSVKICPVTDQRGDPSALHGLCDAGAVQARPPFPVIIQVVPAAGPVTGGTVITIPGRGEAGRIPAAQSYRRSGGLARAFGH